MMTIRTRIEMMIATNTLVTPGSGVVAGGLGEGVGGGVGSGVMSHMTTTIQRKAGSLPSSVVITA
jgi:hypothetical protein